MKPSLNDGYARLFAGEQVDKRDNGVQDQGGKKVYSDIDSHRFSGIKSNRNQPAQIAPLDTPLWWLTNEAKVYKK